MYEYKVLVGSQEVFLGKLRSHVAFARFKSMHHLFDGMLSVIATPKMMWRLHSGEWVDYRH